jgi:putative oxidoreductase
MPNIYVLVGRILLATIFIMSGFSKVGNFQSTVQYMELHGIPMAPFFLYSAITLEVLGGLSLALGYRAKFGIYMLILFLIPATLIFHGKIGDRSQMVHFLKNLSIMGGLICLLGTGTGKFSLTKG